MAGPDVVFAIGKRAKRDEFQYALRSLENLPHGRVFIIGFQPKWVQNVLHIPFEKYGKWQDLKAKFAHLANVEEISDPFYYSEDDYFITEPVDEIPNYHLGTLDDRIESRLADGKNGRWTRALQNVNNALKAAGVENALSFDAHIPMLVEKANIRLDVDNGELPFPWRSVVGNYSNREAVRLPQDVKALNADKLQSVLDDGIGFLSSTESKFRESGVEAYLQGLFPEPCAYERK